MGMKQMIPHHQNAVNQAKIVLKMKFSKFSKGRHLLEDYSNLPEGDDGELWMTLLTIINAQNFQINYMNGYLAEAGFSGDWECGMDMVTSSEASATPASAAQESGASSIA